jgi:hypothetical protein
MSDQGDGVLSELQRVLDLLETQATALESRAANKSRLRSLRTNVTYDDLNLEMLATSRRWAFRSVRALNTASRTGSLWGPVVANPYIYAANNPSTLVDPSGLEPSELCQKALADLQSAIAGGQRRFRQNLKGPIDKGHFTAKSQTIVRINKALSRVIFHCGCSLAQQVAEQVQNLVDQLQQQLDALNRAISTGNYFLALSLLLAIIALLALLLALAGGIVVLA